MLLQLSLAPSLFPTPSLPKFSATLLLSLLVSLPAWPLLPGQLGIPSGSLYRTSMSPSGSTPSRIKLTRNVESFDLLLSSAPDTRSLALAQSCSLPHAGDWLNAVPSSSLCLHFMDREFRVCLQYWLGVPIFEEGVKYGACHSAADPFGDHQVGCGGNGDRILRHNTICDSIFHAARSAALAPRKEVPSLIPGSQSRPADILLPNWERGQPAAMDVTVISSLQPLTIQGAASSADHALSVGEH